ncbi:succinyl-CoA synthetase subunit alpha [Endozoicomonas sp. OPT23]|nr:succinyl-CoA synthetase subunit alpha [Endozoicomonas sp. OPT23]
MGYNRTTQDRKIKDWRDGKLTDDTKIQEAKNIVQIQNVAEIIQRTRPDILVMAEFNNKGTGSNNDALTNFRDNYLSLTQNSDVGSFSYTHIKNVSTNTGLLSPFDLDNKGGTPALPGDGWGFGFYHGQYAFAVASNYSFTDYKSFQTFKWLAMPGAENPVIDLCNGPERIPEGKNCGDPWYSDSAWEQFRVSSKNHIDLAIEVPAQGSSTLKKIHMLVSHPTPPVFDESARRNYKRNSAEIKFWDDYIKAKDYFAPDPKGTNGSTTDEKGGLKQGDYFVVAGDLNADPYEGDGDRQTILGLLENPQVNTAVTTGSLIPTSKGAQEYLSSSVCKRNCQRNNGDTITSTSGLRLDHVIPSANLTVMRSGVFWPATGEPGRDLVDDPKLGQGKGVSSDHRLVWVDLYIPATP